MNPGNGVQDTDSRRSAAVPEQAADEASSTPQVHRSRPAFQPSLHMQDIQEIIDKLAAVTRQLRHPGHS